MAQLAHGLGQLEAAQLRLRSKAREQGACGTRVMPRVFWSWSHVSLVGAKKNQQGKPRIFFGVGTLLWWLGGAVFWWFEGRKTTLCSWL